MRKIYTCLFTAIFCSVNVFADNGVAISRVVSTSNGNVVSGEKRIADTDTSHGTTKRTPVSRNAVRTTSNLIRSEKNDSSNVSRSVNTRTQSQDARAKLNEAVNTVGRSKRTERASINSNPALRRAGVTLRASTAEVGGRATIGDTGVQTGSNIKNQIRSVQTRASVASVNKQKTVTTESLLNAKDVLEMTSDLNNACQQQYNDCMDQFCAVVDTNQQRCSCSANLARYTKAQEAVEDANVKLNEVAQQIRYVGLSADEIRAIMSATEAELELSKTRDVTQSRSMLEDIADMIKDPSSTTTSGDGDVVNSLLNMGFDLTSGSSDLGLDLFNQSSGDISTKRGVALYNEAKKRCKTVLNRCKDAGGNESQITGNYDLAITKDCIAYEKGLTKLNQTLTNNVRSANLMLQKARLAVMENKNQYDVRGCVGALEKCMTDDMVCGGDYEKCLDPTKKYIDENGEVVLGRNLPAITDIMSKYDNSKIDAEFIKKSIDDTGCASRDGACIVNYLMMKIGMGATVKDGGLCRAVLDKCQDYTYVKNNKTGLAYDPYNEVIVHYIQRAMVNIKSAQNKIISKYASTCMQEVAECYNRQNTQIISWTNAASANSVYQVLTGACYNVALTCGYAVFAYDVGMGEQLTQAETNFLKNKETLTDADKKDLENTLGAILVKGVSEIFYQSLICPENSTFNDGLQSDAAGKVNDKCQCNTGYYVYGNKCVQLCPTGSTLNTSTQKCE